MDPACRVHVPASLEGTPGPHPVLIALHGKGDNGIDFLDGTGLTQANAIVAAPTGRALAWAPAPYASTTLEEDAARIDAIVNNLVAEHGADPERVYLAGFSNGGGLAVALSTVRDRFAGIATCSAAVRETPDEIASAEPVDYLNIHGTYDDVVPYAGDLRSPYSGAEPDVIQAAPAVVEAFKRRNGDAARTEHRRVEGMGHEWPTGQWAAHRGIDVTREILDFFGL
ncbi:PHB depolymerase family esterase [Corynebacterium sp. CNCTC7651]|uniref:alpha/beta hydrolase family esterase n=1 Tax=Corynebacterium sp. CNCTC7651 TaxID=2815361 RepID=UPI001F3BB7CC|nr:PHB depolymerase family esterase [Corynebacterium sp. CNCTC7651]